MKKYFKHTSSIASLIRRYAITMIYHARSGHPGGALSCADILAYLWTHELTSRWVDEGFLENNRFVLSKGHSCPALYAAAVAVELLPFDSLYQLRKLGSPLQGHPHVRCLPWVETSTGSLGQGLSSAIGMAIGLRHKKSKARTYVMLGDGELQEGEIWEGAMCAGHYKLDRLCGIIDYNKMQSDNMVENIMSIEPLRAKWEAFNWQVIEINGHDFEEIGRAFREAKSIHDKPTMIIAHTIKGKGVSYMEGSPLWHGSVTLSKDDLIKALEDLDTPKEDMERLFNGTLT